MNNIIYKRHSLSVSSTIVVVYLAFLVATIIGYDMYASSSGVHTRQGETVYAMVDTSSEMYIYVRTLGHNIADDVSINSEKSEEQLQNEQDAQKAIMNEQNNEQWIESTMKVQDKIHKIDGLTVKYRDKIALSDKEMSILYRIVEAEAGGEDLSGRMLVTNVILNRLESNRFPDSIKGIVFANDGATYQFSPVSDGRFYSVNVSKDTKQAVKRAVKGEDNSSGAEYFMCRHLAASSNTRWFDTKLQYLFKHGCHEFFKK